MDLVNLSDAELLSNLQSTCLDTRRVVTRIVVYLGEVEERRLHLKASYSTLYEFCLRGLNMSEGEAFRRIAAARIVRRFPSLLGSLESGRIHLSGLVLLRHHLTPENYEALVDAAAGKSKREVEELIAARFPQPDAPSRIRKLPTKRPSVDVRAHKRAKAGVPQPPPPQARIKPLSETRFKIEFTVSVEFREKLARISDLMRHQNLGGDITLVFDRALDALLDELERKRLGKTARPQEKPRSAKFGHVTRAVRRAVFARDGERCTYVDSAGVRCEARGLLELDHRQPRGQGGSGNLDNVQVRCRGHNDLGAREAFGDAYVARRIELRRRKRRPPPLSSSPGTPPSTPSPTIAPIDGHSTSES